MEHEKEVKLVRFVDFNGAKKIIHPNSTFILRSLQYYRDLEEIDGDIERGDKNESNHLCSDGGSQELTAKGILISCWCIFDKHGMSKYWSMFGDSVMAVFSTNHKVKKVLQEICEKVLRREKENIDDSEVDYYEQSIKRKRRENFTKLAFNKENRRKKNGTFRSDEQEYRFAIYSCLGIDTLILNVHPNDYIDNMLINPDFGCYTHQKELWEELNTSRIYKAQEAYGYGSEFNWFEKIANYNEMEKLFERS